MMLQWGRRFAATETMRIQFKIHKTLKLQWGRRFAATETRRRLLCRPGYGRFNGAVASQRRKPLGWIEASADGRRFNGAVASQRRKWAVVERVVSALTELQWGRRFAATETCILLLQGGVGCGLQWGRRFAATETSAARRRPL